MPAGELILLEVLGIRQNLEREELWGSVENINVGAFSTLTSPWYQVALNAARNPPEHALMAEIGSVHCGIDIFCILLCGLGVVVRPCDRE